MNFVAVLESFDEAVGQVKFSTVVWLHVGLLLKNPNLIKNFLVGSGKKPSKSRITLAIKSEHG